MSKRCLAVAIVLTKENNGVVCGQDELYAEIADALGTMYYNKVSGSIVYGIPTRTLSLPDKRRKPGLRKSSQKSYQTQRTVIRLFGTCTL